MRWEIILLIIGIILIFGIGIAWTVYQWHLCREVGMSFWYCVQHIS